MASLNGITIRKLKAHRGHEGLEMQGELVDLRSGKAVFIGSFQDGENGAPLEIYIASAHRESVESIIGADFEDQERFLDELIELVELEKCYKSGAKKGLPIMMTYRSQTCNGAWVQGMNCCIRDEKTLTKLLSEKGHLNPAVYRSTEEFIVVREKEATHVQS